MVDWEREKNEERETNERRENERGKRTNEVMLYILIVLFYL